MEQQKSFSKKNILGSFADHLYEVCGVSNETSVVYRRQVEIFLHFKFGDRSVNLADIAPQDIISFITERSRRYKPKTTKLIASSLRSFFRFLQVKGLCDASLIHAVPAIHHWRQGELPLILSDVQIKSLLNSFDRNTAYGLRDYAMARCMTDLGLRAGEVSQMSLDDIDWRSGILKLPKTKSRRGSVLPLSNDVGQAIADYLCHGRPVTEDRCIFVRHVRPVGLSLTSSAVRIAMRRGFTRSAVEFPSKGTHTLRRTVAAHMINHGASIKDVADFLRHRHIDTAAIYAKINVSTLKEAMMSWPEVQK